MSKEIIINVTGEHSRIAIVEDGELVELYIENPENVRTIGDIYLGRVRRILPGIKAAFVDIGQKQDAFLHFSDLSDNLPDLLELSDGKVADHLKKHLAKAPKLPEDGESDLELETPQEQRAARRRRDLKRTHSRNRRGRGQKKAADAENDPKQDAAEEPKSKSSRQQSGGRGKQKSGRAESKSSNDASSDNSSNGEKQGGNQRSSAARSRPQPPVTDEVPEQSPSILPADAVAPPPGTETGATEPEASDEQQQKPKRRRGNRGGRGRGRSRSRQTEQSKDETPSEQTEARADDAPKDEASADDKPKQSRSGRSRGKGRRSSSQRNNDTAPDENTQATQASEKTEDAAQPEARTERKQKKSKKSRGRSAKADADTTDRQPEKPETQSAPAVESKPKREASVPSSRFVIDLTSKPNRPKREEEEEEEEKKSSSRSRRGGRSRRRGGRNRRRSSDASGSNDRKSEKNDSNGGAKSGRGRSRSSNGGGRDGGNRSGSSGNGPRPETFLKQDQKLIVKITKEPISSKGPRVSTDVSLAGRFLVLIPQADYVAVSKKIESSKERRRLRALARSLLPEGFGLIVRTVAENRDAKALDTDLRLLLQKWHKIEDKLRKKPNPPAPLHEDVNMVSSIIRDLFSEDYDRIVVDDEKVFKNVKGYVQAVAPQMAPAVKLHESKEHVFRTHKIDGEVRAAFESRVNLPGGGYLFIEHTEAMHVVDVNSGRAGRGLSQEQNALRVNLESARVIAKQLRLRDLGGIICVDFIDMRSDSARKKVYDELKKEFRKDRAVTKLLPMSDFGVVQITRQRLRPSITTTTNVDDLPPATEHDAPTAQVEVEDEPHEARSGPQPTTAEVIAHLERWLDTYRAEVQDQHRKRPILIKIHPLLAAYLDRGIPSTLTRWRFRTRLKLKLDVAEEADPLSFAVRDEKSGKNLTKKYDPERRDA